MTVESVTPSLKKQKRKRTMAELRWIQTSLSLILILHFKAANGQPPPITVRDGDDVTLPYEERINDQDKCVSFTWLFNGKGDGAAVPLIELGQVKIKDKSEPDRLSVTENCSLLIKNVTVEDVGRYTCRQFISGQQRGGDSIVDLSVVTIIENEKDDTVLLICSVLTFGECRYSVDWLYEGNKDDTVITPHSCLATVTFTTSHHNQKAKYLDSLKCNVTDNYTKEVKLFPLRRRSSGDEPGEKTDFMWLYVVVAVVLTVLVSVVVAIRWKKTKEKKREKKETNGNLELSLNPAETESAPETTQDTTDTEGVFYASISHIEKTKSKSQIDADAGDAVTYSTVKVSSSPPKASTDHSNLYATINTSNK